ncbi:MAG: hypothetical protein RMX35_07825 [Nostoc sp. DcaGUA01]|nr:hypothetical protein [Nostoc sp. DcaGUA01]
MRYSKRPGEESRTSAKTSGSIPAASNSCSWRNVSRDFQNCDSPLTLVVESSYKISMTIYCPSGMFIS